MLDFSGMMIAARAALPRCIVHNGTPGAPADDSTGAAATGGAPRLPTREAVPPISATQPRIVPL